MLQGLPNTLQVQPQHHKRKSCWEIRVCDFPLQTPGKDTRDTDKWLASPPDTVWAQKGSICSMFNTKWQQPLCSHNKISHRVSREMYTGRKTGVEPGNPGWPQGLCLLPSQLQKVTRTVPALARDRVMQSDSGTPGTLSRDNLSCCHG